MSALAVLLLGGVGAYWWTRRSTPNDPADTEPLPAESNIVPLTASRPQTEYGGGTIVSSVSSDPGKYVPLADVDCALYEAQIKHLSMVNKFKYV